MTIIYKRLNFLNKMTVFIGLHICGLRDQTKTKNLPHHLLAIFMLTLVSNNYLTFTKYTNGV